MERSVADKPIASSSRLPLLPLRTTIQPSSTTTTTSVIPHLQQSTSNRTISKPTTPDSPTTAQEEGINLPTSPSPTGTRRRWNMWNWKDLKGKGKESTCTTREDQYRWYQVAFELENKGSVSRDHLSNERTYLAWLRTSLSLASIGIAITQLFRLTTLPSSPSLSSSNQPVATNLAEIHQTLFEHSRQLALLSLSPTSSSGRGMGEGVGTEGFEGQKYRYLGKPVGGVFLILALVFLLLGSHRYFVVQTALMRTPTMFPPSRRSVVFSTFCVASIVLATFVAILATK